MMGRIVFKCVSKLLLSMSDAKRLQVVSHALTRLNNEVSDRIRHLESRKRQLPAIYSYDGAHKLKVCVLERKTPWGTLEIEQPQIPGMITEEECRYYSYIGQFYSGSGELVELGPWLGKSTLCILNGLGGNPIFKSRRLYVFDDFVWRPSWMNDKVTPAERLGNHQDFRFLFERYTAPFRDKMVVTKSRIEPYDGNQHVPPLEWDRGPIEILYVDCGRTFSVNQAWFATLSRSFIPDRTVIVMQDWRLHREVPVKWYNQTKQFTDSKGDQLQLVHELNHGGIATFLFRGQQELG
jgi:hypothetical protein